jgi:FkbM family methyltransferase
MSGLRGALGWCRFVRDYVLGHPCNRGGRLAASGRVLGWQVRKRLSARPKVASLAGAGMLRVSRDHSCSALVQYVGLPEYDDLSLVRDLLGAGDWFVDVGANVGIYTVLAARRAPMGRVIAFEPDDPARRELEQNVRLNGLANVDVRGEAVGDARRQVWFTEGLDSYNHVVERPEAGRGRLTAMVTLDGVCPVGRPPAMVKVDVEGLGAAVLAGATRLLGHERPPVWIVEMDPDDRAVLDRFRALSYVPCAYEPASRSLREHGRSRWSDNLVFVRSDQLAAVRRRLLVA